MRQDPSDKPLLLGGSTRGYFTGKETAVWEGLTKTERRVAELVGNKYTYAQIAQKVGIAIRTAETYAKNIADELDAPGKPREKVAQIWHAVPACDR